MVLTAPAPSTVDPQVFKLVSSASLQSLLDKIIGPKTLVLDSTLAGPLGLITEVGLLKNHGVSRMYWLEPGAISQAERNIVYLCRPEVRWMKIIANHIQTANRSTPHVYHLLVVPRMTSICSTVLSDLGVLGSIDVQEYQLGLIPLENDVLSLESEDVWKKLCLDGDFSPVYDIGKALMTVQRTYGLIPRIIGKGDSARRLADLLIRLRKETPASSPIAIGPPTSIDSLIIIDRQVDMVTPLCTQLTYEGLVDEVVGIKNCHVEVNPELLNATPAASGSTPLTTSFGSTAPKKRKHQLSSTDLLFAELRDKNFAVVGGILNKTARRLNDDYERRHLAKTPAELRQFVGQLGGLQTEHSALRLHTGLTEQIMAVTSTDEFNTALEIQQNLIAGIDLLTQENSIRDLIYQEAPIRTIIRLLSLYSVISGGLKPKILEEFKRDILQTYGYQYLPLLISLSLPSVSLLAKPLPSASSSSKSAFALARKPLRLVVDEVDESDPADIAYVFSGYAPLSVRILQCALGRGGGGGVNGWKGIEEVLKVLPGVTFEEAQSMEGNTRDKRAERDEVKTTIVCYLGGITYAEIAAIRFLNRQNPYRNLLIVTTNIVSGGGLITSLYPEAFARK